MTKKTYSCTVLFDASKSLDVEADNPQAAAEQALDTLGNASLCHQCSNIERPRAAMTPNISRKDVLATMNTASRGP